MTSIATASSSPAAPACWCSKSSNTPRRAARASMPRSRATARPRTATTWSRRRARARSAACAWRCEAVKAPIDYINPHATSTPIGDLKEIEAIRAVFGDKCPMISATKSLTGHSLGAAGAQEAIYSLLMMNNGFVCESANIENLDPAFADMPIVRERQDNRDAGMRAVELVRLRRHQRIRRVQAAGRVMRRRAGALTLRCKIRSTTGTTCRVWWCTCRG